MDELIKAMEKLVNEADNGSWHSSEDCRVEKRTKYCALCVAIKEYRKALDKFQQGNTSSELSIQKGNKQ